MSGAVLPTRMGFPTGTDGQSAPSERGGCSLLLTGLRWSGRGLSGKHEHPRSEAVGHRWWEVAPKCHLVGSGLTCWGEGVAGRGCGKTTCYDRRDSSDGRPWAQGRFRRKQLWAPRAGLVGAAPDDSDASAGGEWPCGPAQAVLRKAPRPACGSPALQGGSGLCWALRPFGGEWSLW